MLVVIYPQDKDVASSNKLLDQEVKVENYKEEFVAQNSNMVFQNFFTCCIGSNGFVSTAIYNYALVCLT